MRGKNLSEFWKRSSGSEKKTAVPEFVALLLKVRLDQVDGFVSQTPCFGLYLQDESAGFSKRPLLRCVVWLPKVKCEGFDEVRTLTQENSRRALVKRYRYECGPS
jgi:hypothetical protein